MPWDPAQYERFVAERELPFVDTLALVGPLRADACILDLGCGTGALTAKLADAYPTAHVLGIDTSPEMLAQAKQRERTQLRFVKGAIEAVDQISLPSQLGQTGHELVGGTAGDLPQWDLIFSHAALHWVPDHHRLVPRLMACLRAGGRLVVQLPSNHDHPSQRAVRELADEAPFREAMDAGVAERPTLTIADYASLLYAAGGRSISAYDKVYPHELPDADAAVEWMRGTTIVPYLEKLPRRLHADFLARLRERVRDVLPGSPLFYGFKRTLFAATRQA